MTAVAVKPWLEPRKQPAMFARNGFYPSSLFQATMTSLANQCYGLRTKELFRNAVPLGSIPSSNNTRTRWRFGCHTSPSMATVVACVYFAKAKDTGTPANTGVRITLTDKAGSTTYAQGIAYGGNHIGTVTDTPSEFTLAYIPLSGVPADTDVYGYFEDLNDGRLISASVFETAQLWDTANGYISQSYAMGQAIYDTDRADPAAMAVTLYKRQAAPILHYCCDVDASPFTTSSATHFNVIDGTSTAPSASTPGFTLDLRYCASLTSLGNVPVAVAFYGSGVNGHVELVNSSGTAVISVTGFGASAGWVSSSALTLADALGKYDLRFWSTSGTFNLHAVSVWQYLA